MNAAVITVAGVSSRFNAGVPEKDKVLKAIYSEAGPENTLLYRLLLKCAFADRIIVVGGYQFDALQRFCENACRTLFPQLVLVRNDHYEDLASGYSLYVGIQKAMEYRPDTLLFAEGDLDIDEESFALVAGSHKSVLTCTNETIYANKAVVLYQDAEGLYKYAFNSAHGLLFIREPFSCILNSGQLWKFTDMESLKKANTAFAEEEKNGTNLSIIQRYIEELPSDSIEVIKLNSWTNCNTREDYRKILRRWRQSK